PFTSGVTHAMFFAISGCFALQDLERRLKDSIEIFGVSDGKKVLNGGSRFFWLPSEDDRPALTEEHVARRQIAVPQTEPRGFQREKQPFAAQSCVSFGFLAFGDVTRDAHKADNVPGGIEEGSFCREDPSLAAVRPILLFF